MFRKKLVEYLKNVPQNAYDAAAEADLLIKHFSGLTKESYILGKTINKDTANLILAKAKERVESKKPLQYILGQAEFMGENFIVNSSTLIPRPETELLVRKVLKLIKTNDYKSVLDIGTGTGCIAIMITKLTTCDVVAIDICKNALLIASQNSKKLSDNKINFIQSDLFQAVNGKFDLIVSNPPYIPYDEKQNLQAEVKNFEPNSALFTSDKLGIEVYEKIITNAHKYLKKGGAIAFELGVNQATLIKNLLIKNHFNNISIAKDFDGIERIITGILI